jgi:hypothetical protein
MEGNDVTGVRTDILDYWSHGDALAMGSRVSGVRCIATLL